MQNEPVVLQLAPLPSQGLSSTLRAGPDALASAAKDEGGEGCKTQVQGSVVGERFHPVHQVGANNESRKGSALRC